MAINTVPFDSLYANNVYISIDTSGTDVTADLLDISTLDFEFDLIPSDTQVDAIGGIAGSITVELSERLSNRSSVYDCLEAAIGSYDGLTTVTVPMSNVTLYVQPRGSATVYQFPFDLRFTGVSVDEQSQQV